MHVQDGRPLPVGLPPLHAGGGQGPPHPRPPPAAEEAVDLLLDSGRAPGDVLVITTGPQHPWAEHELSFGETSYWAQHDAGDDVFYADAAIASRAATRAVVVVAVNGGPDTVAATALPLALSRAGALLIVCGDPQRINSVLGAGV
ncbi:hypothetical protein ACFWIJ_43570 [Streptomyces sp. NPDC127079]|uniref:hypothetical protein n=1 Tax=Streptomyces sp. NPDC127079 TaxID=3347132 RepID=UPI0036548B36